MHRGVLGEGVAPDVGDELPVGLPGVGVPGHRPLNII